MSAESLPVEILSLIVEGVGYPECLYLTNMKLFRDIALRFLQGMVRKGKIATIPANFSIIREGRLVLPIDLLAVDNEKLLRWMIDDCGFKKEYWIMLLFKYKELQDTSIMPDFDSAIPYLVDYPRYIRFLYKHEYFMMKFFEFVGKRIENDYPPLWATHLYRGSSNYKTVRRLINQSTGLEKLAKTSAAIPLMIAYSDLPRMKSIYNYVDADDFIFKCITNDALMQFDIIRYTIRKLCNETLFVNYYNDIYNMLINNLPLYALELAIMRLNRYGVRFANIRSRDVNGVKIASINDINKWMLWIRETGVTNNTVNSDAFKYACENVRDRGKFEEIIKYIKVDTYCDFLKFALNNETAFEILLDKCKTIDIELFKSIIADRKLRKLCKKIFIT